MQPNCDAVGHGDSGIYPGGAPETGAQRPPGTPKRYNQEVTKCDLRHNMAGYSGTNGNAVHVADNNIYGNALGVQTDVVTGAGHPGYPGDSALFEGNRIYSNNFNPYAPDSDVKPAFPFPVGTGLWIAGGNQHQVREQPLLRQLAPRHDAVRRARLAGLRTGRRRQRAGRLQLRRRSPRRTTTASSATRWA